MDKKTRQQIALFRHGLIGDLVHRKVGERGLYALLRDKAERVYEIPGSRRTRVAVETLRDWLDSYRRGGFDALYPQPRRDLRVVAIIDGTVCRVIDGRDIDCNARGHRTGSFPFPLPAFV